MKLIGNRLFYLSIFLFVLSACATTPPIQVGKEDARKLTKLESENYALYAMMSSNAYLNPERSYFPIEALGWVRVDLDGKPTTENSYSPTWIGKIFSNLQFDIWENEKLNKTVISFKGTDEKIDWFVANLWIGPSVPYKSAKKHIEEYLKKTGKQKKDIILTGHSLGGGLALSCSLWLGIDAYVFDPSPRVFDGWKDHKEPAVRKVVYQEKEVLSKVRSFWPKFHEVINENDIYQVNFDFNGVSTHRSDYLAEGLLRCSTSNKEFSEIAKKVTPVKVQCNL